jgi:hypothetical protein
LVPIGTFIYLLLLYFILFLLFYFILFFSLYFSFFSFCHSRDTFFFFFLSFSLSSNFSQAESNSVQVSSKSGPSKGTMVRGTHHQKSIAISSEAQVPEFIPIDLPPLDFLSHNTWLDGWNSDILLQYMYLLSWCHRDKVFRFIHHFCHQNTCKPYFYTV